MNGQYLLSLIFITGQLVNWDYYQTGIMHPNHINKLNTQKTQKTHCRQINQKLQTGALTSCCHHFMLPVLLLLVLVLVPLLSLAVGSLLQLRLLIDGACERVLLRVHVQRVLIVRDLPPDNIHR